MLPLQITPFVLINMDLGLKKERVARSITQLWDVMTDDERQELIKLLTIKSYNDKETVYQKGDTPSYLIFLVKGHVAIYGSGVGDYQQIIRMVEPGSIFAYREAFTNDNYQATAIAGDNTELAFIPIDFIFHLIWENNKIAQVFIQELATLLSLSVKRTISLGHKHIRARMAEILIRLKEKYGVERDGITLAVYLSRQSLADIANMTTSNAIRTLSSFVDEGLIKVVGRKIQFVDEAKLHRISEMG